MSEAQEQPEGPPEEGVVVDDVIAKTQHQLERLGSIEAKAREVQECRRLWEEAASVAKSRKVVLERAEKALEELILSPEEDLPLLDREEDDWQGVRLDSLHEPFHLLPGTIAALERAGFETLGDVANADLPGYDAIAGIGETKAEEIQAAIDAFWKRRSDEKPDEASGSSEDEGGDEAEAE